VKLVSRSALYRYYNEHSQLLFERPKFRTDQPPPRHKVVTYRYGVGRGWATGGDHDPVMFKEKHHLADNYIYRMPQVLQAKDEGTDIWWTEGESDADSLWNEFGIIATSHHGGAGKVSRTQASWLRGHRGRIILAYDLDQDTPHGGNVGAFDLILRYDLLRAVGVSERQIYVVHAREGKDIRDHIDKGWHPLKAVPVKDLTPLRAKSAIALTQPGAWFRLGYAPGIQEVVDAIEANPEWKYLGDNNE